MRTNTAGKIGGRLGSESAPEVFAAAAEVECLSRSGASLATLLSCADPTVCSARSSIVCLRLAGAAGAIAVWVAGEGAGAELHDAPGCESNDAGLTEDV